MKHAWMNAVAVAALTAGLAAANAQTSGEQKRQEPQAQSQSQGQSQGRGAEQPSAQPQAQERGQTGSGSEAKSQTGEGSKAGTAQKDDANRTTQSEPKGAKQDRQTQTPDRDSDKRGERAGSQDRKDGGTAQTRDRDNQRAGQRDRDDDRADRRDRDERRAGDRDRDDRRAGDRDRDDRRAGDRDRDDRRAGERQDRQGGDRVEFSERERTTVQESIRRERVERTNINVNVTIGATIPRNVTLHALPAAIIDVNPTYRSYRYIVVRDEIVIINPQTYRVVEVLPYSGGSSVRASRGGGSTSVQLSTEQRRRILTYAQAECDTVLATPDFALSVGTRIPERIELCPFEDVLIQEVDVVRPYRYFVVQDEVVLVDPSNHTIVEVIR